MTTAYILPETRTRNGHFFGVPVPETKPLGLHDQDCTRACLTLVGLDLLILFGGRTSPISVSFKSRVLAADILSNFERSNLLTLL